MYIASPTAENSRGIVLPDYLQLLLGGLLLALLLCIPIIVFTNHVKRAASLLAPVPYSQASAAETNAPPNTHGPGALAAAPIARPQTAGVSLDATQSQSASVAPNRKSASDQSGGDARASKEPGMSKRILHRLPPTRAIRGERASSTLSRAWFQSNSPSHVKAALIAIWHRTLKRLQKDQK